MFHVKQNMFKNGIITFLKRVQTMKKLLAVVLMFTATSVNADLKFYNFNSELIECQHD